MRQLLKARHCWKEHIFLNSKSFSLNNTNPKFKRLSLELRRLGDGREEGQRTWPVGLGLPSCVLTESLGLEVIRRLLGQSWTGIFHHHWELGSRGRWDEISSRKCRELLLFPSHIRSTEGRGITGHRRAAGLPEGGLGTLTLLNPDTAVWLALANGMWAEVESASSRQKWYKQQWSRVWEELSLSALWRRVLKRSVRQHGLLCGYDEQILLVNFGCAGSQFFPY